MSLTHPPEVKILSRGQKRHVHHALKACDEIYASYGQHALKYYALMTGFFVALGAGTLWGAKKSMTMDWAGTGEQFALSVLTGFLLCSMVNLLRSSYTVIKRWYGLWQDRKREVSVQSQIDEIERLLREIGGARQMKALDFMFGVIKIVLFALPGFINSLYPGGLIKAWGDEQMYLGIVGGYAGIWASAIGFFMVAFVIIGPSRVRALLKEHKVQKEHVNRIKKGIPKGHPDYDRFQAELEKQILSPFTESISSQECAKSPLAIAKKNRL